MEIIIKKCIFLRYDIELELYPHNSIFYFHTHRKISPIKWMDDKGFIAQMHYTRDSITCLESSHGPRNKLTSRKVFDRSVVIAMLYVLLRYWDSSFFQKFPLPNIGCKQSPIIIGIIKIIKCHNSFESKTIVKQQCS